MKKPEHIAHGTWKFQRHVSMIEINYWVGQWKMDERYLAVVIHFGEKRAPRISYLYELKDGRTRTHDKHFHQINEAFIERYGLDEQALQQSDGKVRRAIGIQGWSLSSGAIVVKQVELKD